MPEMREKKVTDCGCFNSDNSQFAGLSGLFADSDKVLIAAVAMILLFDKGGDIRENRELLLALLFIFIQ